MKHWNTKVTGIVDRDVKCCSAIKKGKRDGCWVITQTREKKEIEAAFVRMMRKCYGVQVTEIVVERKGQFKS